MSSFRRGSTIYKVSGVHTEVSSFRRGSTIYRVSGVPLYTEVSSFRRGSTVTEVSSCSTVYRSVLIKFNNLGEKGSIFIKGAKNPPKVVRE